MGIVMTLIGCLGKGVINASLHIVASTIILFCGYFFLLWFLPTRPGGEGIIVTLEAKPSLGFFSVVIGGCLILIQAFSDLVQLWSE